MRAEYLKLDTPGSYHSNGGTMVKLAAKGEPTIPASMRSATHRRR